MYYVYCTKFVCMILLPVRTPYYRVRNIPGVPKLRRCLYEKLCGSYRLEAWVAFTSHKLCGMGSFLATNHTIVSLATCNSVAGNMACLTERKYASVIAAGGNCPRNDYLKPTSAHTIHKRVKKRQRLLSYHKVSGYTVQPQQILYKYELALCTFQTTKGGYLISYLRASLLYTGRTVTMVP